MIEIRDRRNHRMSSRRVRENPRKSFRRETRQITMRQNSKLLSRQRLMSSSACHARCSIVRDGRPTRGRSGGLRPMPGTVSDGLAIPAAGGRRRARAGSVRDLRAGIDEREARLTRYPVEERCGGRPAAASDRLAPGTPDTRAGEGQTVSGLEAGVWRLVLANKLQHTPVEDLRLLPVRRVAGLGHDDRL